MRTCNTSMSSLSIDTTSEHNSTSTPASTSGEPRSLEEHPIGREPRASPGPRRASNAADSQVRPPAGRRPSGSSQLSTSSTQSSGNKRPPFEYLMYHHFGTTSLQRFRRLSDVPAPNAIVGAQSSSTASGDSDLAAKVQELRKELAQHRNSCDSSTSGQSARSHNRASSEVGGARPQAASQDSLSRRARSSSASHRLQRSNSVCLSASYLASISSDRQRATYMQMVYRQYFSQLNSHNLWMFAQSFVKRRTLNLRKDCGAAAHAAAAAAALGTSICAAFVGVGPPSQCALGVPSPSPDLGTSVGAATAHHQQALEQQSSSRSSRSSTSQQLQAPATKTTPKHDSSGEHRATQQHTKCHSGRHPTTKTASTRSASKEQPRQQALVAGTKVKRTFTCQTLIMCSSVHIHRERAVKLMSLLNPLQATWIKTDQLLVLEEKPEKVCQALRLFLQGIGYSMSTYERRLRLSSAQTSVSSAESNGSARSLNMEPALASTTSQSLPKPSSGSLQQKMST